MREGSICAQHLSKRLAELTVQGRASISQTTPTTTSTHLRPKATTPRPLHHGSQNDRPNWCQRPWYLTSRLWLRPDDHEEHSEQSFFDACWKSDNFNALISECLDLKDSSQRSFPSPNQNRCKILEDHVMPKSRCPRIAVKCWYYQEWASNTFLNFATIPVLHGKNFMHSLTDLQSFMCSRVFRLQMSPRIEKTTCNSGRVGDVDQKSRKNLALVEFYLISSH